jgi:hypothetical protein
VVLGLCLALSASACNDYLSGPGVSTNPNAPTQLTAPAPLYVGIQAAMPALREGQLGRDATMYTQQVAGVNRQHLGYDQYLTTGGDMDPYFGAVYSTGSAANLLTGGGGLLDIRKMQQLARTTSDSTFLGIGKIYEALEMGLAADDWGDIPYRQAADSTILKPAFDPQMQVYSDIQAQLDSAILFLTASGPSNHGPAAGGVELVYKTASDPLRVIYTEVAHSLKARFYMHTAVKDGGTGDYTLALAQVALGISTPAHDFLWYHDVTAAGSNFWFQFTEISRFGDIAPGAAIIEILKRRINAGVEDSSRLKFYFTDNGAGGYFGYRPGAAVVTTTGGIYNGSGPYSSFGGFISNDGSFRQPEITYAETQLIGAEAALATGNVAAAQTFLDNARKQRQYGVLDGSPVTFPDLASVPATLQNIMEEKYVTLYLNPEVWSDFKRTCLPSLAPAPAAGQTVPQSVPIPGRLPYGQTEVNANPNVPKVSSAGVAVTSTSLNPNQPTACPQLNYTGSVPAAN